MSEKQYPMEVGRRRAVAAENLQSTVSQLRGLERHGSFWERIRYRNLNRVLEHMLAAAQTTNDIREEAIRARVLTNELEMQEVLLPLENDNRINKLINEREAQEMDHQLAMARKQEELQRFQDKQEERQARKELATKVDKDGRQHRVSPARALLDLQRERETERQILKDAGVEEGDPAYEILEDLFEDQENRLKEEYRSRGLRES